MLILGLKEKILAAHRNRINTIILPADNKAEVKELAKKLTKKIKFVLAKSMDEVLFLAIKGYQKLNKEKKIKPALLKEDRDQPGDELELQWLICPNYCYNYLSGPWLMIIFNMDDLLPDAVQQLTIINWHC